MQNIKTEVLRQALASRDWNTSTGQVGGKYTMCSQSEEDMFPAPEYLRNIEPRPLGHDHTTVLLEERGIVEAMCPAEKRKPSAALPRDEEDTERPTPKVPPAPV